MKACSAFVATVLFASLFTPAPTDAAKPGKKPGKKVAICHVNGSNDVVQADGVTIYFGRRIEVAEESVAAHFAHGDGPVQFMLTDQFRESLEQQFGVKIRNADCGFFVNP